MNLSQNNISVRQSAKKNKNNVSQNVVLPKINSAYGNRQIENKNINNNGNFEKNVTDYNVLTEVDTAEENMKGINDLMNKILNQ